MDFTRETLKAICDEYDIEYDGRWAQDKLAATVMDGLDDDQLLAVEKKYGTPDNVEDEDTKETKKKKQKQKEAAMLCNVKHNGVYYKQGTSVVLSQDDYKLFVDNGWAE